MTVLLAVMVCLWLATLAAYWWLLARYKAVIAPTRRLSVSYAAGTYPDPPFALLVGQQELVVTEVDPDGRWLEVRDRRQSDRIRSAGQRAMYRVARRSGR